MVACDDQAELDCYWEALLVDSGQAQACGWLIDRYGLRWQIVPAAMDAMMRDGDTARVQRVVDVMLRMVKLDIAASVPHRGPVGVCFDRDGHRTDLAPWRPEGPHPTDRRTLAPELL